MEKKFFNSQQAKRVVVDKSGKGDFVAVQEAVNSVRAFDPAGTAVIFIKNGVYREKIVIPDYVTNVKIVGEERDKTIISYNDHANINNMGTFRTYTLQVRGSDIWLENLTIENNAEPLGQAVALHTEGDRIVLNNCRLLGNQDTVYTGGGGNRSLFNNCYIEGTTDFIFGSATAWFEKCTIHAKKNSYITAASTPQNIRYGYIFNRCKITLANDVTSLYLGRPWRAYAMTVFMNCDLPKGINPEGWENWRNPENEKTARYAEYNNFGQGAGTSHRVKWAGILTDKEAAELTMSSVLKDQGSRPSFCK
ncbi:MAG: pectinesterase family protein [Petrimonas sp.]|nr:pectinesterase family protein [Petrimonas sp.]